MYVAKPHETLLIKGLAFYVLSDKQRERGGITFVTD